MQLQQKSLKELTQIGWELNVLPVGDRRCRENWIKAISNFSSGSLTLSEFPPLGEVEVELVQSLHTDVENSSLNPRADQIKVRLQRLPRRQKLIATSKFKVGDLVRSKTMLWGINKESLIGTVILMFPRGRVRVTFGNAISAYGGTFDFHTVEDLINISDQAQEAIISIDENINAKLQEQRVTLLRMPRLGDAMPVDEIKAKLTGAEN